MIIKNMTKKTILAIETEIASSTWKKATGLMFRKPIDRKKTFLMVFEKSGKHGIWMFGMLFAIDVIFLDSEKRVIGLYENLKPFSLKRKTWKVYYPEKPARYVLEFAAGRIRETKTGVGDKLDFIV